MHYSTHLKIDLSNISAGLSHQTSNLHILIKYCFQNKLKLCKPIFNLDGKHNSGKKIISDLSEYYDFDKLTVNGFPYKLLDGTDLEITIPKKIYKYGLVRLDPMFSSVSNKITVNLPYNSDITNIAKSIVQTIGDHYICVHVRRGDKIVNEQIDKDTSSDNIVKCIAENSDIKTVYIMTNRVNEIKDLKNEKDYKFMFFTDFDALNSISDNYYLFCVENEIMRLANTRVSTFNTGSNKYYNFYLTNTPGWQ